MAARTHKIAPRGSAAPTLPHKKREICIPWCLKLAGQINHKSSFVYRKEVFRDLVLITVRNTKFLVFCGKLC